ncbi:hypothetical protein EJ04DRAFT_427704 [Polyplosphaeria fusca]|uniref:Uncharacterized protein n=1 Tax=Polyplosphaeria fusca TaxID=682080 RepID=A0A9P4V734_9PLEO|nr:hypothetical protein EJ04DRAFT_427704 [Polyplosphaeria fusca]
MYILSKSIEIAASPAVVREKFLDFSQLSKYHHTTPFFKSITLVDPNKPIQVGDKVSPEFDLMGGMKTEATILENSPNCFRWVGSSVGFKGEHAFRFEESKTTPGGTTFIQEEKFTGAFSFLMGSNFAAKAVGVPNKTMQGWTKYNNDLKSWCEGSTKRT